MSSTTYHSFIILQYHLPLYHLVSWCCYIVCNSLVSAAFIFMIFSNLESRGNFAISLITDFKKSVSRTLIAKFCRCYASIKITLQECSTNWSYTNRLYFHVFHIYYIPKFINLSTPKDCITDIALFGNLQCHLVSF